MRRTRRILIRSAKLMLLLFLVVTMTGLAQGPVNRDRFVDFARAIPFPDGPQRSVTVDHTQPVDAGAETDYRVEDHQGRDDVLMWRGGSGWLEYEVDVPEAGPYVIEVEYLALGEVPEPSYRQVLIDGNNPFGEDSQIAFPRIYEDVEWPFREDDQGSQLRPRQREVREWRTHRIRDIRATYATPMRFDLSAGTHRIRFNGGRGGLAVASLRVVTPRYIPTYEEYRRGVDAGVAAEEEGEGLIVREAERVHRKTNRAIQVAQAIQPGVTPEATGRVRVLNVMGGDRFRFGNDWASWRVDVEESGWYRLAFKFQQDMDVNLTVFRSLMIDGEVPFREALVLGFAYDGTWQNMMLGTEEDGPFEVYLDAGSHEIALRVVSAPYREIIRDAEVLADEIYRTDLEIKEVTGVRDASDVDPFRVYDVPSFIPGILDRLQDYADRIEDLAARIAEINNTSKDTYGLLMSAITDLERMIEDPERIPRRPGRLGTIMTGLYNQVDVLAEQPLRLDRLYVAEPGADVPDAGAGVFPRLAFLTRSLVSTFGAYYETGLPSETEAVDVWVRRGRDYVGLVQQLADQYFTPETGIEVAANFIPNTDILILSRAAGRAPDIALGVGENIPFDFALREALVPLDGKPGFNEIYDRIVPGAWLPFRLEGRIYGIPEELRFPMMFYREDILEEMNIDVPQTWDDVRDILPTLQQENRNFYWPQDEYQVMFFQNEVDFYTKDGLDLAFDRPEGVDAFKEWTDLYNVFALPIRVENFYQRFRDGSVPIGVSYYSDYVLIQTAAPNITGRWKMAPIPGKYDEQGNLMRWAGGDATGAIMLDNNDSAREEKAWEVMRWWASTETQAQYGNDLESYYGIEFRWFPANREVINRLPWTPQERRAIQNQMDWYRMEPFVPGGSYMLRRELMNAWNATVVNRENYRQQFEERVDMIRNEMRRKQEEFDFIDTDGNVLRRMQVPDIPKPGGGRTAARSAPMSANPVASDEPVASDDPVASDEEEDQ